MRPHRSRAPEGRHSHRASCTARTTRCTATGGEGTTSAHRGRELGRTGKLLQRSRQPARPRSQPARHHRPARLRSQLFRVGTHGQRVDHKARADVNERHCADIGSRRHSCGNTRCQHVRAHIGHRYVRAHGRRIHNIVCSNIRCRHVRARIGRRYVRIGIREGCFRINACSKHFRVRSGRIRSNCPCANTRLKRAGSNSDS